MSFITITSYFLKASVIKRNDDCSKKETGSSNKGRNIFHLISSFYLLCCFSLWSLKRSFAEILVCCVFFTYTYLSYFLPLSFVPTLFSLCVKLIHSPPSTFTRSIINNWNKNWFMSENVLKIFLLFLLLNIPDTF